VARKPSAPPSPTQALAERVVAWHNRHPLAERIGLDQVQSIGVVAMPFVQGSVSDPMPPGAEDSEAPAGRLAKLRHGLAATLRRLPRLRPGRKPQSRSPTWQAVFSEDFLEPLRAAQVRPWAALHAVPNRPGDEQWSQRIVLTDMRLLPPSSGSESDAVACAEPADPGADGNEELGGVVMRYAATAALVLDQGRRRVLIGTGKEPSVLGRRSWSVVRISVLTATLASLITVGATLSMWRPAAVNHASWVAVAAPAASQPASAAASNPPPAEPSAASPQAAASDAHPELTSDQAPPDAHAATGAASAADEPASVPRLAERSTAPEQRRDPTNAAPPLPVPAAPAAAPRGPVFALVSRGTQTESESRSALSRMAAAAAPLQERLPGTHTEVMRSGGRWAAVWWPFTSRDDASQARWALALKGVTVDVVEF